MKFVFPSYYTIIEDRYYTEETTSAADLQALKNRVSILEPGIVMYREIPKQSIFTTNLAFTHLSEISEEIGPFHLIVDLREAGRRPTAETRALLNQFFNSSQSFIKYVVFITPKNPLINNAIKFLMYASGYKNYHVVKSKKEALSHIHNVQQGE